jgi:hypothetical protein
VRRLLLATLVVLCSCGEGSALRIENARPPAAPPPAATTPVPPGGVAVGTIPVPNVEAAAWWQDALWLLVSDGHGGMTLQRLARATAEAHRPPAAGVAVAPAAAAPVLSVGDLGVWASVGDGRGVVKLDPRTGSSIATVRAPGTVVALQQLNGAVWALTRRPSALAPVAPAGLAGEVTQLPGHPVAITQFAGSLWIAGADGHVTRVSGDGKQVLSSADVRITPRSRPTQITAYRDRVWVFVGDGVVALDPASGQPVIARAIPGIATGTFAAGTQALWVVGAATDGGDASLIRIDPATGRESGSPLPLHAPATGILTGGGAVWVVTPSSIVRVVPADE